MTTETPDNSAQYLEEFLKQHNINEIPEQIKDVFNDFLLQRAAVRSMYIALPDDNFNQGLGKGDSPQQELVHQIEHTRLRLEGIQGKPITSLKYADTHQKEHEELLTKSRTELTQSLDETTESLFNSYKNNTSGLEQVIQMPYNQTLTGKRMLEKIVNHDSLHAGMLVKFCDAAGAQRTAAMKKAWG